MDFNHSEANVVTNSSSMNNSNHNAHEMDLDDSTATTVTNTSLIMSSNNNTEEIDWDHSNVTTSSTNMTNNTSTNTNTNTNTDVTLIDLEDSNRDIDLVDLDNPKTITAALSANKRWYTFQRVSHSTDIAEDILE